MDVGTIAIIAAAIAAASEVLALIPGMKSNSIFQLIFFVVKAIINRIEKKEV